MKLGSDSKQAIESLALDKGVAVESMYEALVSAFRSAYMRIPGAAEEARVTLNPDSGEVLIYAQELDNEGNVIEEWKVELVVFVCCRVHQFRRRTEHLGKHSQKL